MRINCVEYATSLEGLHAISMKGLGDTVVLAGRNGSGKSRILRAIAALVGAHCSDRELAGIRRDTRVNGQNLQAWKQQVERLQANEENRQNALDEIAQISRDIAAHENAVLIGQEKIAMHASIEIDAEGIKPIAVLYQVRDPDLKDHRGMRINEISSAASSMTSDFNINLAKNYGLAALHDLISRCVYASGEQREVLEVEIERLKILLREFLGAELNWDGRDGAHLFGRPIADAKLSDGQKVLLQVALSIFFQDGTKEGLILLLDEPENHLHPSAVIDLVSKIRGACPTAQIWIATHSIHLLAQFESHGIWFVHDGKIEFSGRGSTDVLESLLGGEEGANQLADFLALPTRYAVNNFAAQCMMPPAVSDTDSSDPQTTQITGLLAARLAEDRRKRILDFGMGKGRLLSALLENCISEGLNFSDRIEYFGFDYKPSPEDEALCRKKLSLACGSGIGGYLSGYASLERLDDQSVDVIVMCNVLHEIDPSDWLTIFGAGGSLSRIIRPDGVLMIVEDQVLRVGERAHRFGFLVMDEAELRQLFGLTREDGRFRTIDHDTEKYRGRLKAHVVPGIALRDVTRETRSNAVRQLRSGAHRQLKDLQGEQYDRNKARAYAFWSHQYVNASLAIPQL